ncbi:uncharacterized protein LOC130671926 [Microplitis mediator]|uniref:uncharacterized protein LOC130671926 n=1 Tax=Microplitis mediator TaxID=375433 RepID=UPI002553F90B|nr:uncharacterized protein LOC130671926 [Microplitis mediator]
MITKYQNVRATTKLLESLGFLINKKKSKQNPQTRCNFLGFTLDSEKQLVELTVDKRVHLSKLLTEFISKRINWIRDLSELLGKLVAACPGIDYGWLYLRPLEGFKSISLVRNNFDYDVNVTIPEYLLQDLHWWIEKLKVGSSKIKKVELGKTIFTDASDTGSGATDGINNIHGFWMGDQEHWHINYKELYMVKLALESLAADVANEQILLRIDNTTAIAYVNKMGGTRYQNFNNLTREIWQWAERKDNFLFASYILSEENVEANCLSRLANDDTEWELANYAFERIINSFSFPEKDLFATAANRKCSNFCSRFPDEKTTPKSSLVRANSRTITRQAFIERGCPEESAETILASLTPSAMKQYHSALQPWCEFCGQDKLDPLEPNNSALLRFLTAKQKEGVSYSWLNTLRSAVSLLDKDKVGADPLISRFMIEAFKLNPAAPKYAATWDVSKVLKYLAELFPLEELSTVTLTLKLVMLLALLTAHRAQTLASIKIHDITEKKNALEI